MAIDCTRRAAIGGILASAALPGWAARANPAPGPLPTTFSVSAMTADVAVLRRAYEALHPGLYRYQTPARSTARFDVLAAAAGKPMTPAAFYLTLSRFLATIGCGHSYANFYNQSKVVQAALFDSTPRLPLSFLWLGSRMIVTGDPYATGIAPGSEILSVDGRSAGEIIAALMTVARADGGNDAKRRRLMSVQGEDGYESFDLFHALMFGGGPRYRLVVQGPGGKRRTATVEAVTLAQRRAQRGAPINASGDTPQWSVVRQTTPAGDAAVLTMPGWGLYNSTWDWAAWLNAAVDRLIADKVPRLVVDIRGNEGGEDCGDALVARLATRAIVSDDARRLVRYRRIPPDLRPYLDTWDRAFDDWGEEATPYDARFLELTGPERKATVIAPKGPRYTGKVVVLTGAQNSSATFQFAQMMQRERLATLVGETTGGNRRGINGGAFYFLRLPETGLEVDLPLIGTFPRGVQPNAGIVPDLTIATTATTAKAIGTGRDEAMIRALTI